ncbi:hypothetical protein O3P69_000247 [Scylla paramamosain]|uniref:Uncharacterized protein n=1 Tax=Scylla paramamosain TaxID=85552 RepID=A0AAW0UYE0_SCYPA
MDKKQTAVAMKLLKEAVKPVIKSKTLQDTVAYIDEALEYFAHDRDTQMYMTLFFDFMQDVYEGKQAERVDKIVHGFITDNSDEVTARTMRSMWDYLAEPVDRYFFDTMRSYFVRPISKAMNSFAERIGTWMGNDNALPHSPYPPHTSWSKTVKNYARKFSDMSRQARQSLAFAADVLQEQDQARYSHNSS